VDRSYEPVENVTEVLDAVRSRRATIGRAAASTGTYGSFTVTAQTWRGARQHTLVGSATRAAQVHYETGRLPEREV
jgi:hypothetical protein